MLHVPREARVRHVVSVYGGCMGSEADGDADGARATVLEELAASVESLRKRRGGAATAAAHEQLQRGDLASVADAALEYYDGLYDAYAESSRREHVLHIECAEAGQGGDAARVLEAVAAGAWRT